MTFKKACILTSIVLLVQAAGAFAQSNLNADTENCLLCHRYPAIGRYDKSGLKRVFYVNDKEFAKSVHGHLKCTNCHIGLDKIPHTDIKKVDCATKCHIEEPSTDKEFSHANMIEKYELSVHGKGTQGNPKPFPEDRPKCKDCHSNRVINPFGGMMANCDSLSYETMARCTGCHTNNEWAERFYSHMTHRMSRRRVQKEIVELCTSCHEDQEKMSRHGLESIETFKDTFHWTQIKYGVENAPDCVSCHVPQGYSTHDIRPREDEISPLNMANRVRTCSNQDGLQTCHPGATERFSTGRVHAYGVKAQMAAANSTIGENQDDLVSQDGSSLLYRANADMQGNELLHFKVIKLLTLVYKLLIVAVIGFMSLHQTLDYIRAKINHKKNH